MRTPDFWQSPSLLSTLLVPCASLYDTFGTLHRSFTTPTTFPLPVICVGNLTAGGAGKTPVAIEIGHRLRTKTKHPVFLSRGYGGRLIGPTLVNPRKDTARDVGDEPMLLSRVLPTVISKDRLHGGYYAVDKGATAIVMDDGFQNPHVAKTISLLVIDGTIGFGNGRLIPAGPLRETPMSGFRRAHCIIVINPGNTIPRLPSDRLVLFARTQLTLESMAALKGKKVVAFSGIAYPQKFFDMVSPISRQVVERAAFPDHYFYTPSDLKTLAAKAEKEGALLVTTAKDAVRLPAQWKDKVTVMEMALDFDNSALLNSLLDLALKQHEKA